MIYFDLLLNLFCLLILYVLIRFGINLVKLILEIKYIIDVYISKVRNLED